MLGLESSDSSLYMLFIVFFTHMVEIYSNDLLTLFLTFYTHSYTPHQKLAISTLI